MSIDATNPDLWPGILRAVTYGLTRPEPPLEHVDWAFIAIDRPDNAISRREYLAAIRTALASSVDIANELGHIHPDSVTRQYLRAVDARLRRELGE